jgi:hypothetical protein
MNPNPSQTTRVNVNLLSAKCQTKRELYMFLTQDGQAYLPKLDSTNVYFFRQIISGHKDVKYLLLLSIEFLVYQKKRHEGLSSPSDRRPNRLRLPGICENQGWDAQILARHPGLGPH